MTSARHRCFSLLMAKDQFTSPMTSHYDTIPFGVEKLEWYGYRWWKNFEDIFICFDMIYERDGQTPHDDIGRAYASYHAAKTSKLHHTPVLSQGKAVKKKRGRPRSADTICPRPHIMTQVQHFVSRIKKRQRWEVQTMWAYDLDLWPWRSWRSSSSIRIPSLKFVGLAIWKIRRTMCVSINGPGDLDLWPFDLETGMRVAPKVWNLPSKVGHARPLSFRIICYVRDGRADGRTDGQKQRLCPLPTGAGAH